MKVVKLKLKKRMIYAWTEHELVNQRLTLPVANAVHNQIINPLLAEIRNSDYSEAFGRVGLPSSENILKVTGSSH